MKSCSNKQVFSRRTMLAGATMFAASVPMLGLAAALPMVAFDITTFGAVGDGKTLSTTAIQSAVDACAKTGGGVVLVPPGQYASGAIALRSNVTLHLSAGSVIKSSANRDDFGDMGALIFAKGERNIAVTGSGILHGNHESYVKVDEHGRLRGGPTGMGAYDPEPSKGSAKHGRPRTVFFIECQRVQLNGIRFVNGATWTVHMMGCRDLWIEGVTIDNDLNVPNNDGMDIDHCSRVRISNCDITAGDDALCFKTSNRATGLGPCEDIVVTNCNLTSHSSAIKLGSAGFEPIRNLICSNCTITDSNRGVAIQNRDGGVWENIMFSQMTIETRHFAAERWGASEPIHISNLQRKQDQATQGKVKGVFFTDLICNSEAGAYLFADPTGSIEDIVMRDVSLTITKPRSNRYGFSDLRPSYKYREPTQIQIAGVHATGVNGLAMSGVDVRFSDNLGKGYGSALRVRDSQRVESTGVTGQSARPGTIPGKDLIGITDVGKGI